MHGLSLREAEARAQELLDLVGLEMADRGRLVIDYSMGMKKKVALAAALIHSPEVLFLDEPFNGVDVPSVRALRDVLQELVRRGVTVFFSSHVMEVVEKLCTSVAVIDKGVLKACGTLEEARASLDLPADASVEAIFLKAIGHAPREVELAWLRGEGAPAGIGPAVGGGGEPAAAVPAEPAPSLGAPGRNAEEQAAPLTGPGPDHGAT
jgi:ABC-2 type transport system ATP-binding protein